jgi:hypothetical protein
MSLMFAQRGNWLARTRVYFYGLPRGNLEGRQNIEWKSRDDQLLQMFDGICGFRFGRGRETERFSRVLFGVIAR